MATPISITPARRAERFPAHPSPSPIMIGFGQVLAATGDLIVAEVDIVGNPGHDPAFDAWFTAASRARTIVLGMIDAVLDLTEVQPGDTHLKRVLHLLQRVMVSDDAEEIVALQFAIDTMPERFFVFGVEGIDGAVNRLALRGLDSIEQYLTLGEMKVQAAEHARADADCDLMPMF